MPNKPLHPCPGRGPRQFACPNLIGGKEKYCPECEEYEKQRVRGYEKHRDETPGRQFLHSTVWRRISTAKLNRDPLCERCLTQGRERAAVLVHHKDRDELNNQPDNHESLCNACHEEEHRKERWGN